MGDEEQEALHRLTLASPAPVLAQPDDGSGGEKSLYELVVELSNTVIEQALALKREKEALEERVLERTAELEQANLDSMYMLATAAEARDRESAAHLRRVEWLSREIAVAMGLDAGRAIEIGRASVLHDVGKLHVPEQILTKPGPLADDERVLMELHTVIGERIISTRPYFDVARRIARSHHENFAGAGYPDGLIGEAIPLEARIVRVADVADALLHERPYKQAWPVADVLSHLREHAGRLFDPDAVEALLDVHARRRLMLANEADESWMI